jgi:hypothetical protein
MALEGETGVESTHENEKDFKWLSPRFLLTRWDIDSISQNLGIISEIPLS